MDDQLPSQHSNTTTMVLTEAAKNQKRKGDFVENNHVVVVKAHEDWKDRLEATKQSLRSRRQQYLGQATGTDPLLESIKELGAKDHEPMQNLLQQSKTIQQDLEARIQQEQDACQHESSLVVQLSMNLQRLEQHRDQLLQDMDEIDQRQIELQHQIALHQQEAAQEIEYLDTVDEERKREVPRLKHAISLYASTTGIKWDFTKEDVLSGSVVSKKSIVVQQNPNPILSLCSLTTCNDHESTAGRSGSSWFQVVHHRPPRP